MSVMDVLTPVRNNAGQQAFLNRVS